MKNSLSFVFGVALSASLLISGCDSSKPRSGSNHDDRAPSTDDLAVTTDEGIIGKAPPPIQVAKWIKGEPLEKFEKGKVYVVDFWATWCSPCVAAIPHLTRLVEKHEGKVEVIGISISERQESPDDSSYIDVVESFVAKKGERMGYRVAVDTPDKKMHATWFKPAGTGGIPTAYIIDQNGKVAWTGIGSPEVIDRIVGQVLDNEFDRKREAEYQLSLEKEAKARAKEEAAKRSAENSSGPYEQFPGYEEAMKKSDTALALAILDQAFAKDPALEAKAAYQWKLMLLMQRNKPTEVNNYVKELLEKFPANGDVLSYTAACVVSTEEESRFDNDLCLAVAKKSVEFNDQQSRFAQFAKWRLGWAYFHVGERNKAIEWMKAAQKGIESLKSSVDFQDLDIHVEDALELFESDSAPR